MSTSTLSKKDFSDFVQAIRPQRGIAFGFILILALLFFEMFNYSTTEYALTDLLGDLDFLSVRWATILAIAFCGIDFAGIARLFTPQKTPAIHNEAWYLFGAWLLAATMNAMLTWWGVSLAVLNHQTLGNAIIERQLLLRAVPIFVAVMIWLIRVLIIGSFSVAGDHILNTGNMFQTRQASHPRVSPTSPPVRSFNSQPKTQQTLSTKPRNPVVTQSSTVDKSYQRPEPTYHPLSMSPTRRMDHNAVANGTTKSNPPQFHG